MHYLAAFMFSILWGAFCATEGIHVEDGLGKTVVVVLPCIFASGLVMLLNFVLEASKS